MLSIVVIAFLLAAAIGLYFGYQWDVAQIEKDLRKELTYVVGLSPRQYAKRVYWQRISKDYQALLKSFKNWFKRFSVGRYWNVQTVEAIYIIPCIGVTVAKDGYVSKFGYRRYTLALEVMFLKRWYAIEVHYKRPSHV